MASANMYLSANVVDRLTRPLNPSSDTTIDNERESIQAFDESFDGNVRKSSVISASTYIGALQTGIKRSNSLSNIQTPRRLEESSVRSPSTNNKSQSKTTAKNFEQFLERQKIVLKKREENSKQVGRKTDYNV